MSETREPDVNAEKAKNQAALGKLRALLQGREFEVGATTAFEAGVRHERIRQDLLEIKSILEGPRPAPARIAEIKRRAEAAGLERSPDDGTDENPRGT